MNKKYGFLRNEFPTIEEYINLCSSVGWGNVMNFDVAEKSIANSIYSVIVKEKESIVGMGRIVGDGAIYFYIQDIVVHPQHQGKGIGKRIVEDLLKYLEEHAPNQSFVGLFASEENEVFYQKYDFKNHAPSMTGMFKVITK